MGAAPTSKSIRICWMKRSFKKLHRRAARPPFPIVWFSKVCAAVPLAGLSSKDIRQPHVYPTIYSAIGPRFECLRMFWLALSYVYLLSIIRAWVKQWLRTVRTNARRIPIRHLMCATWCQYLTRVGACLKFIYFGSSSKLAFQMDNAPKGADVAPNNNASSLANA
jgi:hypothetical protein